MNTFPAAAPSVSFDDLGPGTKYRVEFDDCCAKGHFDATFVGYRYGTEENDRDEKYAALFDIGEIGPSWGQLEFTVLP